MSRDRRLPESCRVAIVGAGRLGQALGKLLSEIEIPMLFVAARRHVEARRAVRFIGAGRAITLSTDAHELLKADVILLTVSDAAVPVVASDLSCLGLPPPRSERPVRYQGGWSTRRQRSEWQGKVILHTCGSLSSSVLQPLRKRGAAIGSLHPFQTVPSPAAGVRNLKGCYWGLEGDPRALSVARGWVKALGGIAFRVRPDRKTNYHLAAFLVCPTVVTLMEHSLKLLGQAGVPVRIARPMLTAFVCATARNFAELGAPNALTGPAVRGDWPTIERHLAALRRFSPRTVPVYKALCREMLRLAHSERVRGGLR